MTILKTSGKSRWTGEVDLSVLFFNLTIDAASEFLFGESTCCQLSQLSSLLDLSDRGHKGVSFARAFDKAQLGLGTEFRLKNFSWLIYPSGFSKACAECHEFIDHFVQLALSKTPEKNSTGGKDKEEKYVFLEALAMETRDPLALRSQLLHILLAGRDNTASLLGWLFYCLVRDPTRYQKLRSIILEEFGTYELNPSENITFAKPKSCAYLQHCMSETLRVYPVVPLNSRQANKDTTLPHGGGPDGESPIFIPAGHLVEYSVYSMHRRRDIWGEDADQFNPERWMGRRTG